MMKMWMIAVVAAVGTTLGAGLTTTSSYESMGCFADGVSPRSMAGVMTTFLSTLTPKSCHDFCQARGYQYFGLQYSYECFCSNSFDSRGLSTACTAPCVGDQSIACGGNLANSVYRVSTASSAKTCSSLWGQCGGQNWAGPTCCTDGLTCVYSGIYYSQCKPTTTACAAKWGRCGGSLWAGKTCCVSGSTCVAVGPKWSHCTPNTFLTSTPTVPAPAPTPVAVVKAPAPTPPVVKAPSPTPLAVAQPAPTPPAVVAPAPTPLVVAAPAPTPPAVVVAAPTPVLTPPVTDSVVVVNSGTAGAMPQPLWTWGTVSGVLGFPAPSDSTYSTRGGKSSCYGGGGATISFQCPHMMLASPDMVYAANADGNDWAMYGVAGMGSVANCGQCYQMATYDRSRMWVLQAFNSGPDVSNGGFDIFVAGGGLGLYNSCSGDCASGPGCGGTCTANLYTGLHSVWAPNSNCYTGGVQAATGCDALTSGSVAYKDKLVKYGCKEARGAGYKGNFAVNFERVKCPENLVKVTGLRLADESGLPLPTKGLTLTHNGHTSTMQDCCKASCGWIHAGVDAKFPAIYSCDNAGLPLNTPRY